MPTSPLTGNAVLSDHAGPEDSVAESHLTGRERSALASSTSRDPLVQFRANATSAEGAAESHATTQEELSQYAATFESSRATDDSDDRPRRSNKGADPMLDVIARVQGGSMKMSDQSAVMKPSKSHVPSEQTTRSAPFSPTDLEKGAGAERQAPQRKYKHLQGGNYFFLGGLIMTSQANPFPFIASFALALALPGLWFGFDAPYIANNVSVAPVVILAYTFAVAIASML